MGGTMGTTEVTSEMSSEVTRLIRIVDRLTDDDQQRILTIVSLLAHAPAQAQRTAQRMLNELLDSDPISAFECGSGVDEVIGYLEDNVLFGKSVFGSLQRSEYEPMNRRRD